MIKTLIKYDLKKMTNLLIYLYPIAIFFALLTRLIGLGKNIQFIFIISQVFGGITYSLVGSILVNTFVQILVAFNRSFYKDESYLTHTLPVEKERLLISKYLSALIVIISSVLVSFASLFLVLYTKEFAKSLKILIDQLVLGLNMSSFGFICLMFLVIFSQICFLMSSAFTAIVKAYTYENRRVLKGLCWFALFYFSGGVIILLTAVILFSFMGEISALFAEVLSSTAFLTIFIVVLSIYFILAIFYYFVCKKLLKNGVNVD